MRIGLATPRFPASLQEGMEKARDLIRQAAETGCDIVCFPESYLPGLRGVGFPVAAPDQRKQEDALEEIRKAAAAHGVAVIMSMEWQAEHGLQIVAWVISETGELLGMQTKNQVDPDEDPNYVPGTTRRLFTVKGMAFGIAICHEGWRYPETVRWAASRGASIVFHPHFGGAPSGGPQPTAWGDPSNTFHEKAMICRSVENTIYFASVNYALPYQITATTLISPAGECLAYLPYGQEGLLVHDVDLAAATGLLAKRYAPERY